MKKLKKTVVTASLIITMAVAGACSRTDTQSETASLVVNDTQVSTANGESETIQLSTSTDNDEIDWDELPTTEVTLSDEGLAITEAGTYVLSGSTTGQVTVNTEGYVRIILNDATIKSSEGAAILIENAEQTVLELAANTTNTVGDAATRSDEEINGAIYSSDDLVITGEGVLNVTANFEDGIVGKDDLWIEGGIIDVTSVDDGIRGKDSLTISEGTLTITAQGDGLKASNDTDLEKGQLNISGGEITIDSRDDAVKAEQKIWITGGTLNIVNSVEGIEAPVIVIDDGDITIYATDDGINASVSEIITTGLSLTINDGNVTVEVGQGDTDALDSNGDLTIAGGVVTLTAQSAVDYDGTGSFTGGTLIVNGETLSELPSSMMGPGGSMGGGFGEDNMREGAPGGDRDGDRF
ncbi:carbohydrate-binding domain-containing protein [Enterococcus olivae]